MEKDFSEVYQRKIKRFRPWAWYFFSCAFLILGIPVVIISMGWGSDTLLYFELIMLVLLIPVVIQWIKTLRCPHCKKFMGRDTGMFCPLCGVRIRKEK